MHSLLITLLMSEEWRMMLEDADKLQAEALANLIRAAAAMVVLTLTEMQMLGGIMLVS